MPSSDDRQRVERLGSRRARLTPAPGTTGEPVSADDDAPPGEDAASGPNDDRLRRDVPPHY
ncbi:MAG: hypothetical protein QM611_09790 [Microbacterium sp.]|uniref:hypothetical protein n=1 Tax=Microbacterium sp. TaxID=51671 RepID=UPI0039E7184E